MKTLIIYASKHGGCKKIVEQLKKEDTDCVAIQDMQSSLEQYDKIVFGSSTYVGKLDSKLIAYMKKHEDVLLSKPLYLFISGLENDEEKAIMTWKQNIPISLLEHASYQGMLGGYIDFKSMNFFEKTVIKTLNKKANFYDSSTKVSCVDLVNQEALQTLKSLI